MGKQVQVNVGWALWGKHPGALSEYSVLACSGEPLSGKEFGSVLTRFMPGTPSVEPGALPAHPDEPGPPGSPPWVTISRIGISGRAYLGISIQGPPIGLDGVGRPINSTSYFCIPFDELKGVLFSYVDLYDQLAELPLPYPGGGLIRLNVRSLEPEEIVEAIDGRDEPVAAAAAAMLLSGPVSIVGSEGTSLNDRLRFLDAVVSLLPYGYRAAYTAATWSDPGKHPIRLAFAARPRQDAGVIRWQSMPMAVTGEPGEAYLGLWQEAQPELPKLGGLVRLVGFLGADKAFRGFDQAQHAVDVLHDFILPFSERNAVQRGTINPRNIRLVFERGRADDLMLAERQELLVALISTADRDPLNWQVVDGWWDRVVGREPLVVLPAMVEASRRLLWNPTPNPLACQEYVQRAADHDITDDLLAHLVAAPESRPDLMGGLNGVVQVVANAMLGRPGIPGLPQTRQALACNPLLACTLLAHLVSAGQNPEPAIAWLEPVLGGPLVPFATVLGRVRGKVNRDDIGQLAGQDREYVAALLAAASHIGRLDQVLPAFVDWLAHSVQGVPDPERTRYWRDRLVALTPSEPGSLAWLDLTLLISGHLPRFLLEPRDRRGQRTYTDTAIQGWTMLCRELGEAADNTMTSGLTAYLSDGRWAGSAATATAVTELAGELTSEGRRPGLRVAVSNVLKRSPEAASWPFAREWLPPAKERWWSSSRDERRADPQPGRESLPGPDRPPAPPLILPIDANAILAAARNMPRDATTADMTRLIADAYRNKVDLSHFGRALADSGAIRSGDQAMALLAELRPILLAEPGKRSQVQKWVLSFTLWFANGAFDEHLAEDFRKLAVQSWAEQIDHYAGSLRMALPDSVEKISLGQEDAIRLERARKLLDDILLGSKKQAKRSILHPGWLGGGEAE